MKSKLSLLETELDKFNFESLILLLFFLPVLFSNGSVAGRKPLKRLVLGMTESEVGFENIVCISLNL